MGIAFLNRWVGYYISLRPSEHEISGSDGLKL
ncbi:hypothetical protein TW90_0749 [Neisseria flavescens]|nr:hypothetical protein TW90_0749 [Neisseria flavescens]